MTFACNSKNRKVKSGLDPFSFSFYKAMKTIIYTVDKLKRALLDGTISTGHYLAELLLLSSRKHLLEKKKDANYSPEILYESFVIKQDGEIVSIG